MSKEQRRRDAYGADEAGNWPEKKRKDVEIKKDKEPDMSRTEQRREKERERGAE